MDNQIYSEKFCKSNVLPEGLQYVLDQIREVHSPEAGWEVGELVIESRNSDGTINISVPLKKYPVEKSYNGRSR